MIRDLFPAALPEEAGMRASLTQDIDNMVEDALARGAVANSAIAVVSKGRLVYEGYAGLADIEAGISVTPNHIYRAASMSKPVTAACVMMQVEAGNLALDDEVCRYLPDLADMSVAESDGKGNLTGSHKAPRNFTIRDLLTHSSGLGSGPFFWESCRRPDYTTEDTLETKIPDWGTSLLQFDPGSAFSYSARVGFEVLGRLVEITSGMDFQTFIVEKLCKPLGMTDTRFVPSEDQWNRLVRAYATNEEVTLKREHRLDRVIFAGGPETYFSGGGGLFTTLEDYVRFAGMLQNFGTLNGVQILKRETVEEMQKPQLPYCLPGTDATYSWGLSMRVVTADNGSQAPLRKGAFGWSGAYGTHFWCDPVNDVFAVYMSNMTTAGGSGALTARHIEKAVMDNLIL